MRADQPVDPDLLLAALRSACRAHRNVKPEDVMGEMYLRLIRVLGKEPNKFKSDSHFISYVHLCVSRLLVEDHRRARRQAHVVDPGRLSEQATCDHSRAVDRPTAQECLDALKNADARVCEVFRLHLEGFQGKDIAAKLRVDPARVSHLLKRARRIIKEAFPRCGGADDSERSDP